MTKNSEKRMKNRTKIFEEKSTAKEKSPWVCESVVSNSETFLNTANRLDASGKNPLHPILYVAQRKILLHLNRKEIT